MYQIYFEKLMSAFKNLDMVMSEDYLIQLLKKVEEKGLVEGLFSSDSCLMSSLILSILEDNYSEEEFLKNFSNYEGMVNYLQYCFTRSNETAYNFIEKIEGPSTDVIFWAGTPAAIAHKIRVWDGLQKSPFYFYNEFGKGNITEENALGILKNQSAINYLMSEFAQRWMFCNGTSAAQLRKNRAA